MLGGEVKEYMGVIHYVSYLEQPSDDQVLYVKMEVDDKYTQCDDWPEWNAEDSSLSIGKFKDSIIRSRADDYEAFDQQGWAANYTKDGSIKYDINWRTFDTSYGPVSFEFGYNGDYQSTTGHTLNHTNGNNEYVRTVQNNYESMILDKVGQYYDATFNIGKYGGSSGTSKMIYLEFIYDISSLQNYTFGGNRTVVISNIYYDR